MARRAPGETLMAVPSWLVSAPRAWPPTAGRLGGRSPAFIRRSLAEIARLLESMLWTEQTANAPGFLQSLEPRVKVVTLLAGLVLTTLVHRLEVLAALWAATVLLAMASALPLRRWGLQAWLIAPSLTAVMALPALFNVVTPGDPLWIVAHRDVPWALGPWRLPTTLAVTHQGVRAAGGLVLRVSTAVSWTMLLTLTTRWDRLLRALRVLGAPKGLLLVLALMHRYLRLVIRQAHEMHLVLRSRTIHPPATRAGQALVASRAAALLRRCLKLSREVYDAMRARGYTGQLVVVQDIRVGPRDWVWIAASAAFFAGVVRWNYSLLPRP